jgi:DNA-binding PadR family transcriptional regulator
MAPVFAHGRLRLYLLKLLDESPRHGYEVIRLLEERFQGLYAPSAGTVYPRLAKLEKEGLVSHTTEGGRKVYSLTDAGREELAARQGELVDLEQEIRDSVSELAAEIREDVRGVAGNLRREVREAAQQARSTPSGGGPGEPAQWDQWKKEWKEQARRAKEESRHAKEEARTARQQAKDAQANALDEVQRIVRKVQDDVQDHAQRGDWQGAVREGLAGISRELGQFGRTSGWSGVVKPDPEETTVPDWAADEAVSDDPRRDLERLLDRFRDDVRDAARDHGVTADQVRETRRHLSSAAARIGGVLRGAERADRTD